MDINFEAFYISIITGVLPEHAFKLIDNPSTGYMSIITSDDKEDMIQMKLNGLTWKEIADIYNLTEKQVKDMVKNYKYFLRSKGVKLWGV